MLTNGKYESTVSQLAASMLQKALGCSLILVCALLMNNVVCEDTKAEGVCYIIKK